jgi:23S rRNA pseudouridine2604 synthase
MSFDASIRLNKYISESGLCSRREADRYIEQGQVQINGRKATVGQRVFPHDRVTVSGRTIEPKDLDEAVYIAFNKPVGITSTTEASDKSNIVDYIRHTQRIFPIGRLDKDSQGLIFLTSNGDIVNKILRAGNQHEKEYLVTVNRAINDQFIEGMSNGVPILGVNTKKCFVKQESTFVFRIILVQGLNRQIRRMCEYFGYEVTKLERIRIMNIGLKGLPVGDWRELNKQEVEGLLKLVRDSISTEEASGKKKPQKLSSSSSAPQHKNPERPAHGQRNKSGSKSFRKPGGAGSGKKRSAPGKKQNGKFSSKNKGRRSR